MLTMPEFRRLTYKTPDGAWGIEGVSLLTCPASTSPLSLPAAAYCSPSAPNCLGVRLRSPIVAAIRSEGSIACGSGEASMGW